MCVSWKRVDIVSASPSALTSQYVLLIWFSEHREAYFLFLIRLFITHLLCLHPFQRSVVAPSRTSPPDVSCLRATPRHMSTTCTAFGPSRQSPEAPSGLSGALHFGALLDFWLHCSFPGDLSIRKLSIHFQFSLAFFFPFAVEFITFTGCCVISLYWGRYWPIAELPSAERKYPSKPPGLRLHQSQAPQVNSDFDMNVFFSASLSQIRPCEAFGILLTCWLPVEVVLQRDLADSERRKYIFTIHLS